VAPHSREEAEPRKGRRGGQRSAADAQELHALEHAIGPALSPSEKASLRSQRGPDAGGVLTALPKNPETQTPSAEKSKTPSAQAETALASGAVTE
jgi:hypothetical protein